jgi:Tol biopolymer transport system component
VVPWSANVVVVRGVMRPRAAVSFVVLLAASWPAAAQVAALISRNSAQEPADSHSYRPSLSAAGRYAAFDSWAGNLAPGVDVANSGVFVRDLAGGTTVLASTAGTAPPNGKSYMATISGDGRFIAFWSQASNLVADDTNGEEDLFVYERATATLTRVNLTGAGTQADPGDHDAHIVGERPSLSADGRFVAFDSRAANLVAGDLNDVGDVFVRDRQSGTTERINLAHDESEALSPSSAPSISADGRYVAFISQASLTPDDGNGSFDVYVFDRQGPALQRIGPSTGSAPSLSADGRVVAFDSYATDLVPGSTTNGKRHVFVYDRTLAQMTLASMAGGVQGDDDSSEPTLSADGRIVAFRSAATNLVAGDLNGDDDIFVRDRLSNVTTRVSVLALGTEGDAFSRRPALSADGFFIAFESAATNFGFDDAFGAVDLFLGVREDACLADPGKLFPGVCGCGTPDADPDHDGTPDCVDGCPNDANKVSPGPCDCGVADDDSDADGTADCHDPATSAALKLLVQQTRATVKRLKANGADRATLVQQIRTAAGWFSAAGNNATLSTKQRKLVGGAAAALTDLADATGRLVTRKRAKALGVLRKLLKASRR